jgi:DNA-binding XRE family transcriptional regulator
MNIWAIIHSRHKFYYTHKPMTKDIHSEPAKRISAETVSNLIKDLKKIGVLQEEIAKDLGVSRQAVTTWKRKGVAEQKYNKLVVLYEKKFKKLKKSDGYRHAKLPGRVHLRTNKLFAAGGVELNPKPGETYTCCTMIIVNGEFPSTNNKEEATCRGCLKRLHNLY